MSPHAASVVAASGLLTCSAAHLGLLPWLVSGGKLSVVLRAEAASELLLEPSTSPLAKVSPQKQDV